MSEPSIVSDKNEYERDKVAAHIRKVIKIFIHQVCQTSGGSSGKFEQYLLFKPQPDTPKDCHPYPSDVFLRDETSEPRLKRKRPQDSVDI